MLGAMTRFEKEVRLMMHVKMLCGVVMGVLLLVGCGVPRETLMLARVEAAIGTHADANDAQIREKLVAQEQAWKTLAALMLKREFNGIVVDEQFVELVQQVAALAKRQRQLIERQEDDTDLNRQTLERFERLWRDAERYLAK